MIGIGTLVFYQAFSLAGHCCGPTWCSPKRRSYQGNCHCQERKPLVCTALKQGQIWIREYEKEPEPQSSDITRLLGGDQMWSSSCSGYIWRMYQLLTPSTASSGPSHPLMPFSLPPPGAIAQAAEMVFLEAAAPSKDDTEQQFQMSSSLKTVPASLWPTPWIVLLLPSN